MKRKWTATLLAVVATVAPGAAPAPARAQIPVTDIAHIAETIAQAIQDFEHYVAVLERLEDPEWRDLLQLVHAARALAGTARALSYADSAVLERFFEVFPDYLALTQEILEAGITAERLVNEWRGIRRDTAAGALASVAQLARDYDDVRRSLERIKGQSDSAAGTGQQLHAGNELGALAVQELLKTNQSLGALIQLEAVQAGRQDALEGLVYATERAVLEGVDTTQSYGDFTPWH